MNYKFELVDSAGTQLAVWILPPPVVLGRSPDAQISIGDASISRRHCKFVLDADEALTVRDLDSLNGIYVENRRVTKAVLKPGDLVRAGAIMLRIEWTDEDLSSQPPIEKTRDVGQTQPMKTFDLKRFETG